MPIVGVPYPWPPPVRFPAGGALDGDLSGPIFAGPPHDPFKSFHAASSQLLQVVWSSLNNISLPSWVALLCFGFRTRAFFFFLPHFPEPPVPLSVCLRERNVVFLVSSVLSVNCCEVASVTVTLEATSLVESVAASQYKTKQKMHGFLALDLLLHTSPCMEMAFQVS